MAEFNRRDFNRALLGSLGMGMAVPGIDLSASGLPEPEGEITGSITDVPGISVGHATDKRRPTGCSVLLFGEEGAATGVDFDGSAPGTYQVALLQPVSFIQEIWGIVLSGGSSFGLATPPGVVRYLQEHKIGLKFGIGLVPIVCGAIIYDLEVGDPTIFPDADLAYQACEHASTKPVEQGNVGAGAGATVGKMLFREGYGGMKAGVGTASLRVGDVVIGAMMVVNAAGNIVDWRNGKTIAGARAKDQKGFVDLMDVLQSNPPKYHADASRPIMYDPIMGATTIGVVATNATFNKTEMTKICMMANCGAARCINPYHTPGDGDTLFAVSTRKVKSDLSVSVIGSLAAEVVSRAVIQSAKMASSIPDWPAYRDYTVKSNK